MRQYNNQTIELLAPAGNMAILKSIVDTNCDAVYFGGRSLNMRMIRKGFNFTNEELKEAIELIHSKGKLAYITVNSLLEEAEVEEAKTYLRYLASIQPDALIVQDLGIIQLIKELELPLIIHASVMMNVHNVPMIKLLQTQQVTRVVVSRETTLEEVQMMKEATGIEIEYFTHGDMCVAHGGACYYSSMLFGMSSNRGRCLKPCRWWFSHGDSTERTYPLAVKDMAMYPYIKEMVHAGVTSFKIEGRMREKDFICDLINDYGDAIDGFIADPTHFDPTVGFDKIVENRKRDLFTGYAFGKPGKDNMNTRYEGTGKFYSTGKMFSQPVEEPLPTPEIEAVIHQHLAKIGEEAKNYATLEAPINSASNTNKATNSDLEINTYQTIKQTTNRTTDQITNRITKLSVKVQTMAQAKCAINFQVGRIYLSGDVYEPNKGFTTAEVIELSDLIRLSDNEDKKHTELFIATPRMMNEGQLKTYDMWIRSLVTIVDGLMVGDMGSLYQWRDLPLTIVGDYSLNISNPFAARFYTEQGMSEVATSLELSADNYSLFVAGASDVVLETVVFGRMPGMYFEHDFYEAFDYNGTEPLVLHNEAGEFQIYRDQHKRCHMLMRDYYNLINFIDEIATSNSVHHIRYEAQVDDVDRMSMIIKVIQDRLGGQETNQESEPSELEREVHSEQESNQALEQSISESNKGLEQSVLESNQAFVHNQLKIDQELEHSNKLIDELNYTYGAFGFIKEVK